MPLPELNIRNIAGVIWGECGRLNHSPPDIPVSLRREYATRTPTIYEGNQLLQKEAMAVLIVNRHQQRIYWGNGSVTMRPIIPPEPHDAITSVQWGECMDAASYALSLISLPIDHGSRFSGAQYYQHSNNETAPFYWHTRRGIIRDAELVDSIGPSWDNRASKGMTWLRIYCNGRTLSRSLSGPGVPHTDTSQSPLYQ